MLEMKDVDFDSKSLCAYRRDIATLFVHSVARILALCIHIITLHTIDKKITSFKFWLTLFLFMDLNNNNFCQYKLISNFLQVHKI